MFAFVLYQIRVGFGHVVALVTSKELFIAMAKHVLFQLPTSLTGVITFLTSERLHTGMHQEMCMQLAFGLKLQRTQIALMGAFLLVAWHVMTDVP